MSKIGENMHRVTPEHPCTKVDRQDQGLFHALHPPQQQASFLALKYTILSVLEYKILFSTTQVQLQEIVCESSLILAPETCA